MKYLIILALLFIPLLSYGHMMDGVNDTDVSIEELGAVDDIMLKMMNGEELSDAEWQEMQEFMQDHHGSTLYSMMPMMIGFGGHYSGGNYWLSTLISIIWLVAGILLIIFLLRKLNK